MKLQQLRYFVTVGHYGNFTRAAVELHISQPSLSSAIRELESEFGLKLFRRGSRGVECTEAGDYLMIHAQRLLLQADQMVEDLQSMAREKQMLRLGVPPMLGTLILPQLLKELSTDLELCIEEHGTLTNLELLNDCALDAALVSHEAELPENLSGVQIGTLPICFIKAFDPAWAGRETVSLRELTGYPLVMLGKDSFLTSQIQQEMDAMGQKPNVGLYTNQLTTIGRLIRDGKTATFGFPGLFPADVSLLEIPVKEIPPVAISLVWRKATEDHRRIRRLLRCVMMV